MSTNDPDLPEHMWVEVPLEAYDTEGTSKQTNKPAFSFPRESEKYANDYGIKYDSRTKSAGKLKFSSVETSTDRAILLNIDDDDAEDGYIQEWFPKKLCSNMDMQECTIYVWIDFLEDVKEHLTWS